MAKRTKKNEHESFKTTNKGKSINESKSLVEFAAKGNIEEAFMKIAKDDFGLAPKRADYILSSFVDRISQLADKAWSDDLTLQTIEIATIENSRSMQVDEAIEVGNGIWVKRDSNGESIQLLTEHYELVPPLTKKEVAFLNWAMKEGEIQLLPIKGKNDDFMIGVINNYPESVILIKP